MTADLAAAQLDKLKRDRQQCDDTIEEYESRKLILDAQIAALTPLAIPPAKLTAPEAALAKTLAEIQDGPSA